jgi:hypothetical protein
MRRCSRNLFYFFDLRVIRPEHHLRPKPIFARSPSRVDQPLPDLACSLSGAQRAAYLVAVWAFRYGVEMLRIPEGPDIVPDHLDAVGIA